MKNIFSMSEWSMPACLVPGCICIESTQRRFVVISVRFLSFFYFCYFFFLLLLLIRCLSKICSLLFLANVCFNFAESTAATQRVSFSVWISDRWRMHALDVRSLIEADRLCIWRVQQISCAVRSDYCVYPVSNWAQSASSRKTLL